MDSNPDQFARREENPSPPSFSRPRAVDLPGARSSMLRVTPAITSVLHVFQDRQGVNETLLKKKKKKIALSPGEFRWRRVAL